MRNTTLCCSGHPNAASMAASEARRKSDVSRRLNTIKLAVVALCLGAFPAKAQEGHADEGARAFRACAACHSLEPDRNMTGPSLAGVVNRKAGTLPSFTRYSEALKHTNITWDTANLERFLEDPAKFIPGNHMTFPGVPDAQTRANIVAFLKQGN